MKAAVVKGLDTLRVEEVPTPECEDGDALVRVGACAICGSDIRILHHGNPRVTFPAILGHEAAGEVVAVGKRVKRVRIGDRIAIGGDVPCGTCTFCIAGLGNNCPTNYAMGYQFPGSFAQYVLLNELVLTHGPVTPIPDRLSFEEAALAEPLGCVLHALEMCRVQLGDTVVIMGAGPIGYMLAEVSRHHGASRVILVNRSSSRLQYASRFGVTETVCSSETDPVTAIRDLTQGRGADVILTACPSPEAQAQALNMARNRARINFFGGLPPGHSQVTLDTNLIHYRELFVLGSHGCLPRHHAQAVELLAQGIINAKKYISHRFALDDIEEAFRTAESHGGLRVVVLPNA
jgi:L-iditol 2-dehydrogenase